MSENEKPSPVSSQGDVAPGQVVTIHHWLPKKVANPGSFFPFLVINQPLTDTATTEEVADTSWVGEMYVVVAVQLPFVRVKPLESTYYKHLTWDLRRCVLMEIKEEFLSDEELQILLKIRESIKGKGGGK